MIRLPLSRDISEILGRSVPAGDGNRKSISGKIYGVPDVTKVVQSAIAQHWRGWRYWPLSGCAL